MVNDPSSPSVTFRNNLMNPLFMKIHVWGLHFKTTTTKNLTKVMHQKQGTVVKKIAH